MRQTLFRFVYGVEAIIPIEYIVPILCITVLTYIMDCGTLEERLAQLEELGDERFLARFHQQVQK